MSTTDAPSQEGTDGCIGSEPTWSGPFPEFDKFGEPTGQRFVRCRSCGAEVLDDATDHATHREGCSE